MRYYVVSDVHSYYSFLISALTEQGFFEDKEPHKLIICGDLFDRGEEASKLQDFIVELMDKDEVILIRGNHEDLMLDLLQELRTSIIISAHHEHNGTVDTVRQLVKGKTINTFKDVCDIMDSTPFISKIIPAMKDYYETENYVFVHGWIPMADNGQYDSKWRRASKKRWEAARWTNGIDAALNGIIVPGKTIVCGHWGTFYGHEKLCTNKAGSDKRNHEPYYNTGIIALDATTVLSQKINCIVIEDKEKI